MKRERAGASLGLAFALMAAGACGSGSAPVSVTTVADSVRGTWRVLPFADTVANPRFGAAPNGYLVYDETGHVFSQVLRRSAMDSLLLGRKREAPDSVLRRLGDAFSAQFGTYSVDADKRVIVHRYEGEMPPQDGPVEVATPFRLKNDSLFLGADSLKAWRFVRVK